MLRSATNIVFLVKILLLLGVAVFHSGNSEATQLNRVCSKEILKIMNTRDSLLKVLDDTKTYIKANKWISDTKQLDVNGHWGYIDEIMDLVDKIVLTLPIVNDEDLCKSSTKQTVELLNYISESNKLILNEVVNTVSSAKNIVENSKCDSQFLCDSFFFYYFQKALADYSFYRFGIFNTKLNSFKEMYNSMPPVNFKKKELILY